ncbi:MAG: insulinase family protein [Deltaproteobacteria bacterium]|nr:insulinase family protein [Deltaproteobacteria bacterium]
MKNKTQQGLFRKTVLPNGLTVLTEKMPHVRSVCIGIWVPTGSRFETKEKNGISHFLEHMFFKGTEKRSALDIAMEVDSLGGEMNAFTSREQTTYYIKVLDTHLRLALDILTDIFLHSTLDAKELERERQVILEEIRMQEDQPEDLVHDVMNEMIWPDQALGFPVAGREENVIALNREDLVAYVREMYNREKLVISCAGNIEHEKFVADIAEYFKDFSSMEKARVPVPPRFVPGMKVLTRELEQVHLCLSLPGVAQADPDRFAFYILNTLLGANMSSRLFQEVREKRGLAYSVYSYLSSYRDGGNLTIYTGANRDRIREVLEVIRVELDRIARHPVTAKELHRAKEYMKGGLMLSLESSSSVMSRIAKQEISLEGYQSVDEIVRQVEAVTADRIREIAAKCFQKDRIALAAIGPVEEKDLLQ